MKINFNIFFGFCFHCDYMSAFLPRQESPVFFYIFIKFPEKILGNLNKTPDPARSRGLGFSVFPVQ